MYLPLSLITICTMSMVSVNVQAIDGLLDPELIQLYQGTNLNPFDVNATNNLALKLISQGKYDRALKLLSRAKQLAPERSDIAKNAAHLSLLIAQMENLDLDTTLTYGKTFRESEVPFVPEPWGATSTGEYESNPSPEASIARAVSSSNPFDSQSLLTTAGIKIDRGDYRGALKDLRRAKVLSPWLAELDPQIKQLESRVSELGQDIPNAEQYSIDRGRFDDFENPEPPSAWQIPDSRSPN